MENVGVGLRAVAVIIDIIIIVLVAAGIVLVLGYSTVTEVIVSLLGITYIIVLEATQGATLGKKALGLKVVKMDGTAISWKESIIRNLLRIVDGLFFYLVGAIIIWVTKSKQRLGDIVASTIVVKG